MSRSLGIVTTFLLSGFLAAALARVSSPRLVLFGLAFVLGLGLLLRARRSEELDALGVALAGGLVGTQLGGVFGHALSTTLRASGTAVAARSDAALFAGVGGALAAGLMLSLARRARRAHVWPTLVTGALALGLVAVSASLSVAWLRVVRGSAPPELPTLATLSLAVALVGLAANLLPLRALRRVARAKAARVDAAGQLRFLDGSSGRALGEARDADVLAWPAPVKASPGAGAYRRADAPGRWEIVAGDRAGYVERRRRLATRVQAVSLFVAWSLALPLVAVAPAAQPLPDTVYRPKQRAAAWRKVSEEQLAANVRRRMREAEESGAYLEGCGRRDPTYEEVVEARLAAWDAEQVSTVDGEEVHPE